MKVQNEAETRIKQASEHDAQLKAQKGGHEDAQQTRTDPTRQAGEQQDAAKRWQDFSHASGPSANKAAEAKQDVQQVEAKAALTRADIEAKLRESTIKV